MISLTPQVSKQGTKGPILGIWDTTELSSYDIRTLVARQAVKVLRRLKGVKV